MDQKVLLKKDKITIEVNDSNVATWWTLFEKLQRGDYLYTRLKQIAESKYWQDTLKS